MNYFNNNNYHHLPIKFLCHIININALILICFFPQNLSQILVGLLRRLLMFHGRLNQQKVAPLLWHQPTNQPACLLAPHIKLFQNSKFIYLYIYITYTQGGTICGAIEESSRSLKSIDKCVL